MEEYEIIKKYLHHIPAEMRDEFRLEFQNTLHDVIQSAITAHEAEMFPKAKEDNAKDGWTLDYQFVKSISERTDSSEFPVGMEETESVLIALRDRNIELSEPHKP